MAEMTREQAIESLSWLSARLSVGLGDMDKLSPHYKDMADEVKSIATAIACLRSPGASPETDGKAGGWVRTSERMPTEEDGVVAVVGIGPLGNYVQYVRRYFHVVQNTHGCPYWMPLPALPEVEL